MKKEQNKKLIEWGMKLKSKKQKGQWCTLLVRREKRRGKKPNYHRRQSDHRKLSHPTPNERGHDNASAKIMKD
jgi:hypothetical protein